MLIRELDFSHPLAVYAGGEQYGAVQVFTDHEIDEHHAAAFAQVRTAHAGFNAGYYYLIVRAQGVKDGKWWGSMVLIYAVDGDSRITIVRKGTDRAKYFRSIGEFEALRNYDEARAEQVLYEKYRAARDAEKRQEKEAVEAGSTLWARCDVAGSEAFQVKIMRSASPQVLADLFIVGPGVSGMPEQGNYFLKPDDAEMLEPCMLARPVTVDVYRSRRFESNLELSRQVLVGERKPFARWTIGSMADVCGKGTV